MNEEEEIMEKLNRPGVISFSLDGITQDATEKFYNAILSKDMQVKDTTLFKLDQYIAILSEAYLDLERKYQILKERTNSEEFKLMRAEQKNKIRREEKEATLRIFESHQMK